MTRKKDKPEFKVEVNNTDNSTIEPQSFIQALVQNFQQGAYCILEALRLVNAEDKDKELDLILNDEQHSPEYETKQRFPYLK